MKFNKIITLIGACILAFNLSACENLDKDKIIRSEKIFKGKEDTQLVKVDHLPYKLIILEPHEEGMFMEGTYKNNSDYPITNFRMTILFKDNYNIAYIDCDDTVMPDKTSPRLLTIGPEYGFKKDVEVLEIEYQFKVDGKKKKLIYDAKLGKYKD